MNTSATHRPTQTNVTMKEKEAIIRNDRRVASTYLDHTHSDEGGRFAKPQTVIGSDSVPQYPMAAPNWSVDPTGVEPALGIDVNAVEPCGEKFEIEALGDVTTVFDGQSVTSSLARATADASVDDPSRTGGAEAPLAVLASPADGEPPAIPTHQKRRGL